MPLCMCGHEEHEHGDLIPNDPDQNSSWCTRCTCDQYRERPGYLATTSVTDLPVSQGARDLYELIKDTGKAHPPLTRATAEAVLDYLAEADEKDVRNLLWARRVGKL
jgi:hypothetical protein